MAKRCMLALIILASAAAAASAGVEPATLAVTLVDGERLPPGTRQAATAQVERIFASADVEVRWMPSDVPIDARQLVIEVVLTDAMARQLMLQESLLPDVLGVTGPEVRRAYVFVDRVMHLAVQAGTDPGDTLGSIIAHELGHILLEGDGHSSTGLRQPAFEMYERGPRRFTPAEADAIRVYLRGRT